MGDEYLPNSNHFTCPPVQNDAYDAALRAAIADHGPVHVLDIGTGTGILSMMVSAAIGRTPLLHTAVHVGCPGGRQEGDVTGGLCPNGWRGQEHHR